MTDVLIRFDTQAEPKKVIEALTSIERILGFWTSKAEVSQQMGETLELSFAQAPLPFDLTLEESGERTVVWRTETFPPHWVGTSIHWDVEPKEGGGAAVGVRHEGFTDDEQAGRVTFTWGFVLARLKELVGTGRAGPVFS